MRHFMSRHVTIVSLQTHDFASLFFVQRHSLFAGCGITLNRRGTRSGKVVYAERSIACTADDHKNVRTGSVNTAWVNDSGM